VVDGAKVTIIKQASTIVVLIGLASCISNSKEQQPNTLNVMSLNVFGWKTMPQHASNYAALVDEHDVSVLVIQEGVEDWKIDTAMPTDYSRAIALEQSLGLCWQRQWQIYVNRCQGVSFTNSHRFDLADGPNAVRTGELALIDTKFGGLTVINVHWDHESETAQEQSAKQVADKIAIYGAYPTLLAGDFNRKCTSVQQLLTQHIPINLTADGGIDCVFSKGVSALGTVINAAPSDHPAVIAEISFSR